MAAGLSLITIVLLAVVGGVVLWLHWRLDALQRNAGRLPMLAQQMTATLLQTQKALAQLKQDMHKIQPEADGLLIEARNTRQDVTYLLDKAEKVLGQLEKQIAEAQKVAKSETIQPQLPKNVEGVVIQDTLPLVATPAKTAPVEPKTPEKPAGRMTSQAEQALRAKLGMKL